MDISSLTPEERAALKAALDEEQADPFKEICEVIQKLADGLDMCFANIASLRKLVEDDMIGSIRSLYDENVHADKMNEFKGKYGSMLDPLAESFKKTYDGDLHEQAFKFMDKMRREEGYTDEVGEGRLKEVLQTIKEKLGLNEPVVAAEVTKVEEPAPEPEGEGEDEMSSLDDEIARMKNREKKSPESDVPPARRRA
jgi:hypothetical protein